MTTMAELGDITRFDAPRQLDDTRRTSYRLGTETAGQHGQKGCIKHGERLTHQKGITHVETGMGQKGLVRRILDDTMRRLRADPRR